MTILIKTSLRFSIDAKTFEKNDGWSSYFSIPLKKDARKFLQLNVRIEKFDQALFFLVISVMFQTKL